MEAIFSSRQHTGLIKQLRTVILHASKVGWGLLEGASDVHMGPSWFPASFPGPEPATLLTSKHELNDIISNISYFTSGCLSLDVGQERESWDLTWRRERVNATLKAKQGGSFLIPWPWSRTSALFTRRQWAKMVLTEGRKLGVRGRAGKRKPKESWALRGLDLFLYIAWVTVLVQCGKMSDSSSPSSLSFSVYVVWVSRLLHHLGVVCIHLCI